MGATLSQPESFKNCSKTSDSDVQLCTAGKVRKNMMEKYLPQMKVGCSPKWATELSRLGI